MKIYTKTGDAGQTGLFGGPRVAKDDARIEAYGTVDELNAAIGLSRSAGTHDQLDAELAQIQNDLFDVGAQLATPDPAAHQMPTVGEPQIRRLEETIDWLEEKLEPLRTFILPGGSPLACHLHLARCVCRRAERRVVTFSHQAKISGQVVVYLNRLSDLLFVMARYANQSAQIPDVPWTGRRKSAD